MERELSADQIAHNVALQRRHGLTVGWSLQIKMPALSGHRPVILLLFLDAYQNNTRFIRCDYFCYFSVLTAACLPLFKRLRHFRVETNLFKV